MKIKILFLHHKLVCGGAEQALFDLLCLLDQDKFDITVLVRTLGGEWDQKFRDAGIKVIEVWDCQKKSRNPLVKLENMARRCLISHSIKHGYKKMIDICFYRQFDIVVSNAVWGMPDIEHASGAKLIKYIHGDVGSNSEYKDTILRYGSTLRRFDRIICVSEEARRAFCELTGLDSIAVTCHNPLNSDNVRALAQRENPVEPDVPVLCAVGRLAQEKGFDRLIRIHREILDMGIPHRLVIVGDGPEREKLEQCIAGTKTRDSVILAGYTANPYPYIKNCTFMVCSSFTEGLPVVAMEALCLGTPIVSAVASVGELFEDDCCGLITENDDASLKNGIVKMLTDADLYVRVKAGALAAGERFDGRKMVQTVEKVYCELLNG